MSHSKFSFHPKLLDCLKGYNRSAFTADLCAGFSVGILALPLAMAFGIASGVTPEQGIYTAIIAGFIISVFGGSKVQIGGPTGAFIVIVAGIIGQYGYASLAIATLMAGVFLIVMGITKMGNAIRYIPRPVVVGFTNGIAILIMSTQIKDFFGLPIENVPEDFIPKCAAIANCITSTHLPTLFIGLLSMLVIVYWPLAWRKRVPGQIGAIFVGTFAALAMAKLGWQTETIYTRFGDIPNTLPKFHWLEIDFANLKNLVMPAFTIAILAAIESLLSAVVADGMIDDKHDSNQELIAQGIANVATPFFLGIPATGAIARTATNIKNGGRTPIAGVIHCLVLLAILIFAAPYAQYIPLATLSAVLFVVAFNMGDWSAFPEMKRLPRSDDIVFISTFLLTVVFGLTLAIEVGMILAAMLFIRRISQSTQVMLVDKKLETDLSKYSLEGKDIPEGVMVFRIFGALMFGAADKLESILTSMGERPRIAILRMRTVLAMDATALDVLDRLYEKLKDKGVVMMITGAHSQPLHMMQKSGFLNKIGEEFVLENIDMALAKSREILGKDSKINNNLESGVKIDSDS